MKSNALMSRNPSVIDISAGIPVLTVTVGEGWGGGGNAL